MIRYVDSTPRRSDVLENVHVVISWAFDLSRGDFGVLSGRVKGNKYRMMLAINPDWMSWQILRREVAVAYTIHEYCLLHHITKGTLENVSYDSVPNLC